MAEQKGHHIIEMLRRKWQRNFLSGALLSGLAFALLLATALNIFAKVGWWSVAPMATLAFIIVYLLRPFRRISNENIASFLNRTYPQLEESSQLLLAPADSLTLLQQLQKQKIEKEILRITTPSDLLRPLKKAALTFTSILVVCVIAITAKAHFLNNVDHDQIKNTLSPNEKEIIPPGIKMFSVMITPPSYTRMQKREQEQFSLKVEEGSQVSWLIKTTGEIDSVHLRFNNKESVALKRTNTNEWTLNRLVKEAGFYQLELAGNSSALYTLEVIHDQPANIRIISPQQYTTIEPGRKPVSNLRLQISDDYGISNALIIATKASGKGESVSFKEQQLSLPVQFNGQKNIETSKLIDLASMGLQGGDELYFYIKATDNHGQESRSDMYFISLPDTAELLSLSGMDSGVDQFPEYFRSQRQIIIDTEKLLKEQSSVSKDTFNTRSNQLGIEQKLLRLRYGKFLVEENESGGEGHSPDDGHDHGAGEEPAYGDVQAMIDQYAHKHDNAEDATFFEPQQKAQLKAILTEMWNSELKLRTYVPAEALPYQYKALRLLKDLQQKSRAYVSKTSIRMPPLKPEKRLTGKLEKIDPASQPPKQTAEDKQLEQLRNAVTALEMLKQKKQLPIEDQQALIAAEKAISEKAMAQPVFFLPALSAVRSVMAAPASASKQDILSIQKALQQIIISDVELPRKTNNRSGSLADHYFKKLNQ
ncbi:DUF4175 domain-containing protein [Terrimonas sp. NA20]|uniref:DUF4175 domain-containing protein n=1 Tax=Terrimonas ginsenosidimutans TaxID=2908004 RepID=A0ABS9L0D5_9BACT|nr:DUF4175 domain-containing protein [Terrimonas ginsenosidimutans]MCG2617968.1 DUF4175 domain-containing protein [Terrimonas ginsenosidimutans]